MRVIKNNNNDGTICVRYPLFGSHGRVIINGTYGRMRVRHKCQNRRSKIKEKKKKKGKKRVGAVAVLITLSTAVSHPPPPSLTRLLLPRRFSLCPIVLRPL
jgi:hypothetical protein